MIRCIICGEERPVFLHEHILTAHGMTTEEYRTHFPNARISTYKVSKGETIGVSGLPVYPLGGGYLGVFVNGKDVYEHRYIMEMMKRRKLKSDETVHHKDGNRHNNHPSNLELISKAEHNRRHALERMKAYGRG